MTIRDGHPRSLNPEPELMRQFESIGDNCEFGFVQWYHGVDESGLLRFASTEFDGLLRLFDAQFQGAFDWEDMAPYSSNMVRSKRFGVAFHTDIRCVLDGEKWKYATDEEARRQFYDVELGKLVHLQQKLLDTFRSGDRILVYKRNAGLSHSEISAMRSRLDFYSRQSRLLCVTVANGAASDFLRIGPGVRLGLIDRLAPYTRAEDSSYERWTALCRQAASDGWE